VTKIQSYKYDHVERDMTTFQAVLLSATLFVTTPVVMSQDDARKELIERAKSFELNTPYVPPPGDPMEHYASGYAKIMCSSVFITGLDPAFAAENVGYFTAPYEVRAKLGVPKIDREKRTVEVRMPNGIVRIAKASRQPGVRNSADRQDRRFLQAVNREEHSAGRENATVADG
jgi:hypothetical protein